MAEEERRELSFVGAAAWTLGVTVLLEVAVAVTEAARPGAAGDLVNVTACHALSYLAVVFAMLRVYAPDERMRDVVAFRPAPVPMLAAAAALGACLYPALDVVDRLMDRRFPQSQAEEEILGQLLSAGTLPRRVVLALALLVVIPVTQELFFRGALFGRLRRKSGALWTVLGTAAFFATARADLPRLPSVLAIGLVLGWLRDRSGSIIATVTLEAAFFAVPVVPVLRGADAAAEGAYPQAVVLGGLAGAAVVAGLVELWSRRGAPAEG